MIFKMHTQQQQHSNENTTDGHHRFGCQLDGQRENKIVKITFQVSSLHKTGAPDCDNDSLCDFDDPIGNEKKVSVRKFQISLFHLL